MKKNIFYFFIVFRISVFAQNDPESNNVFDNISKPGVISYTPSEKLAIDSFATMVEEYKNLEKRIIEKLYADSIGRQLKQNLINQYVCNIAHSLDNNLQQYVKLIKNDFLLFPKYKMEKGREVMSNCITSFKIRNLVAQYIIDNRDLNDCSSFNQAKYFHDNRFSSSDIKSVNEICQDDKAKNLLYTALLLRNYEPEFRKIALDENANECNRAHAKLLLAALDKNK